MPGIPPEIEVYPVHHLPIIKAYADQLGLVGLINHYVPTEMDVDAGTVVLGLVLDTGVFRPTPQKGIFYRSVFI